MARASSWVSRSVTSGARRVPPALVGHSKSKATYASTVLSRSVFMTSTKVGTMPDLLLTSVVGSYPQPDWLVDRAMLSSRLPPRTRALEIWRVAPGRGARRRVPAGDHDPNHQGDAAGTLHHVAAGAGRLLPRRRGAGDGAGGSRQRRGARPVCGRCGRGP